MAKKTWKNTERHPLSAEYGDINGKAWEEFEDAFLNGRIPEKITVVVFQGMVLDGWQRFRCCTKFEIKPTFVTFSEEKMGMPPEEYVQIVNDHRRHEPLDKLMHRIEQRRERIAKARSEGKSIRTIADAEGVDTKTVQNDLSTVDPSTVAPPEGKVVGKDGKKRDSKVLCARCKRVAPGVGIKGCDSCKAERQARKSGKTAGDSEKPARGKGARRDEHKAETSKPVGKDALGNEIPKRLRDTFGDQFLATAIQQCKDMEKWAKASAKDFPYIKLADAVEHLQKLEATFENSIPYAVHQQCGGKGCERCYHSGYLTHWLWYDLHERKEKT